MQTSDCEKKTDTLPSRAVLLSIKPRYCYLIAEGKKNIEVRKNRPKLQPPFKCYIYCTSSFNGQPIFLSNGYVSNSKIIGEFICDRIEYLDMDSHGLGYWKNAKFTYFEDEGLDACITKDDFLNYTKGNRAFGWHISNFKKYDKPRELSEINGVCSRTYCSEQCKDFGKTCDIFKVGGKKIISRPPQSWCYVD